MITNMINNSAGAVPLDHHLKERVEEYRVDYESRYGSMKAAVFVCPFTGKEITDVEEICKGHIFNNCVKADRSLWVPQWKEFDNRFGSIFESDFEIDLLIRENSLVNILRHEKANKAIKLRVNDKPVGFSTKEELIDNPDFVKVEVKDGEERAVICVHRSNLNDSQNIDTVYLDPQINPLAFFVTILKSSYLHMFRIHGYRFAYSCGGDLIGRHLLGRFFKEIMYDISDENAASRTKKQIQEASLNYLRDYFCLVHPISFGDDRFRSYLDSEHSTSTKPHFLAAVDLNDKPWAYCVLFKVGNTYYTTLLPNSDHQSAPEKYEEYLRLKGDIQLWCRPMYFDLEQKAWHIEKKVKFPIPPCKIDSLEVNFEYEIGLLN